MKIFISLPLKGKTEEEVTANLDKAKRMVREKFGSCQIVHGYNDTVTPDDAEQLWYLGGAIQMMDGADAILFLPGWQKSKSCLIEYEAARLYGITRYYPDMDGKKGILQQV